MNKTSQRLLKATSCDEQEHRRRIRRRRSADFLFSVLGGTLVAGSLTVLIVLFGQLVIDGTARLTGGHFVKSNGYAPGVREIVGRIVRNKDATATEFLLQIPEQQLTDSRPSSSDNLALLDGQAVIVQGESAGPGSVEFTFESIESKTGAAPIRYDPGQLCGILSVTQRGCRLHPEPLPILMPPDASEESWEDLELIAVTPGISKSLPLKLKKIAPLVRQSFLSSMPSRDAHRAGVKSALVGSLLVIVVTMILAIPLGVAAGVWLEEYGRKNLLTALIEINIANLAGVPSIIWGLMALGILVYYFEFGRSLLTAGMTLALLVLPIVITATREAIRAIPVHVREASFACGASKWQTVKFHVLPYSFGGILTGSIIGLSRAIGETAPLITIGALTYVAFLPDFSWSQPFGWLKSGFTVLPIQMFNWISRPDKAFHANAAAAGVLLLVLTLGLNAVAVALRYRVRKNVQW